MEQEKITTEHSEINKAPSKNKGGRPKGKSKYGECKVTFYLSKEEYGQLTEFARMAWYEFNYSGAARFLLLKTLKDWEKRGKKKVDFYGSYK